MSRSQRPRKPYRPRPAGRPVLHKMRGELVLPAYVGLETLRASNDPAALESAWHSLAACLDYMGVACRLAGRPAESLALMEAGKVALIAVHARQTEHGRIRCTGPELVALREAIVACDQELPHLSTHHIQLAVMNVDRKLFGSQVAHHLRVDQKIDMEVAQ